MSCCGRKPFADSGRQPRTAGGSALFAPSGAGAGAVAGDPLFQYVGATGLSVTGPVTGRVYRFAAPGARLAIDRHDAASLLYVPMLKPVRG